MDRITKSFLIIIAMFLTSNCENSDPQSINFIGIKKVIIKAQPSFHNNSLFVFDIGNGDMLFDKLGNIMFLDEERNHNLVPFSYSFNDLELVYLQDSIISILNEDDFIDLEAPVMDGISTDMLFIFKSDDVKKVHLSNRETTLQSKLIEFAFETVIKNCSDSSNISYARRILEYYN